MKTLHKKVLTVCLALMMAVVMAVPAFAANANQITPRVSLDSWSYFRPYLVPNDRMTVVGAIGNDAPVQLSESSNTSKQQFLARYTTDGSLRIFSRLGYNASNPSQSYTLNAYRSGNWPCTMLKATADNRSDSEVDFHTVDSYTYRIVLVNWGVYLTQNGLHQNLTWGPYAEAYEKAWAQMRA